MERPAAIERFIMELLADPEPPPVSRPEAVLFLLFRYRYMYGISRMLAVFMGSGQQLNETLCVGNLRVSFRVADRMYFLQNRLQKFYNKFDNNFERKILV